MFTIWGQILKKIFLTQKDLFLVFYSFYTNILQANHSHRCIFFTENTYFPQSLNLRPIILPKCFKPEYTFNFKL